MLIKMIIRRVRLALWLGANLENPSQGAKRRGKHFWYGFCSTILYTGFE